MSLRCELSLTSNFLTRIDQPVPPSGRLFLRSILAPRPVGRCSPAARRSKAAASRSVRAVTTAAECAICASAAWLGQHGGKRFRLSAIYFEEVRRHAGTDAAHIYGGLLATLTAWCEQHASPIRACRSAPSSGSSPARATPTRRLLLQPCERAVSHPGTITKPMPSRSSSGRSRPGGRAMSRERLPDRRGAATVDLEHGGSRFTVTIGFYPDGRPARCSLTAFARARGSMLSWLMHACCFRF